MRRLFQYGLILACLFIATARADNLTWSGSGDGTTFTQAANWSPAKSPGADDDCIVPTIGGGGGLLQFSNQSSTVRSLTLARNLAVRQCFSLTVRQSLVLNGASVILDNPANCIALNFDSGAPVISGSGEIVISNAGAFGPAVNIDGNAQLTISAGVTVRMPSDSVGTTATIQIAAGSSLANNGVIASNRAGGTLKIAGPGTFSNAGTLAAAPGALRIEASNWSNSGTITANGAQVFFASNWSNTGSINLLDSTLNVAGTYPGLGTIQRAGGSILLSSPPTGPVCIADSATGDIDISNVTFVGKSLQASGGAKFISGPGTVTLSGSSLSGTLRACGPVIVSNGLVLDGVLAFDGCSLTGRLTASGPAQEISGSGQINLAGTLTLLDNAALTLGAGIAVREVTQISCGPNSSLTNNGSITNAISAFRLVGPGRLVNAGSLSIQTPGEVAFAGEWTNQSTMVFAANSLSLDGIWSNSGIIESACPRSSLSGTWSNAGLLRFADSETTAAGTYPGIGQVENSGGTFTLSGVCTGDLQASPATGQITLGAVQLQNSTLSRLGSAAYTLTGTSTWTACTLRAPLNITNCGVVHINSSLTLDNALITVNRSSIGCGYVMRFGAGVVPLDGSGIIEMNSDPYLISTVVNSTVTIAPGVSIVVGPGFLQSSALIQNFGTLVNQGTIRVAKAGATLTIDPGTFANQGSLDVRAGTLDIRNMSGGVGLLAIAPAAAAILSGTAYTIDTPIALASGATLTLGGSYTVAAAIDVVDASLFLRGTWTNLATLSSLRSSVETTGSWSNQGSFNFTDTSLAIGPYNSLGTHTFSGVRYIYTGAFPAGVILTADASTGDIGLNATLTGSTLRTRDGAKFFTVSTFQGASLSGCTLDGVLSLEACGQVWVTNGLSLTPGARIILSNPCFSGLVFEGADQSIIGQGEILVQGSGGSSEILRVDCNLTIDPGITFRIPPKTGPAKTKINITRGRLINRGVISVQSSNWPLEIIGIRFGNEGVLEATASSVRIATGAFDNIVSRELIGGTWRALNAAINFEGRSVTSIGPATMVTLEGLAGTITQFASLNLNEGTLRIRSRTQAIAPSPSIGFTNAGTLDISSGASLAITGKAAFSAPGILRVEVSGLAPNQVGRVTATGPISLDGKLQGFFAPPYTPVNADTTSPVLESPTITGSFGSSCFDSNAFGLGVLPLLDAAPPNRLSLQVSDSAGITPVILSGPVSASATPHATFHVNALPANALYQWKQDGGVLIDGPTGTGSTIVGATTPNLTVLNAQPSDAGLYTITVSTSCAAVTSDPATLTLCTGDLNSDGLVDDADFVLFLASYNILDCADPAMPPLCTGDLNADGVVDDADFQLFISAYNELLCP